MSQASWQSFHVFYEEADLLLTECIAPLVHSLQEEGLISRFFFLRYWERGSHVRLRFQVQSPKATELVNAAVLRVVEDYMARAPSHRTMDENAYAALQNEYARREGIDTVNATLAANNTLTRERYKPEFVKYGGPSGVELAEELFAHSTTCALTLLPTFAGSPNKRLSAAFTMMLLALRCSTVPVERMPTFLRRYAATWREFLPAPVTSLVGPRAAAIHEQLKEHAQAVLSGSGAQPSALQFWANAVESAARALDEQQELVLPLVQPASGDQGPAGRRAWLLGNYIHTHNNRLGLLPAAESYLCTLGAAALEALA